MYVYIYIHTYTYTYYRDTRTHLYGYLRIFTQKYEDVSLSAAAQVRHHCSFNSLDYSRQDFLLALGSVIVFRHLPESQLFSAYPLPGQASLACEAVTATL